MCGWLSYGGRTSALRLQYRVWVCITCLQYCQRATWAQANMSQTLLVLKCLITKKFCNSAAKLCYSLFSRWSLSAACGWCRRVTLSCSVIGRFILIIRLSPLLLCFFLLLGLAEIHENKRYHNTAIFHRLWTYITVSIVSLEWMPRPQIRLRAPWWPIKAPDVKG